VAAPAHVLVVDIGKTNAKLALVETASMREIDTASRPNRVLPGPPYPHADVEGLWAFVLDGIGALHRRHRVDALVVTTHAATAALVDADGRLALPVLDYEHAGPDELAADYDRARPGFAETGTPRLPRGLNLGAQLFWQFRRFPEAGRTAAILPYPQYWAYRLSGVLATEATSLGCHTDLWNPAAGGFSSLVGREGWAARMPPLRRASDRLGPVTAEVAAAAGLDPATPVHCGIHDSNASLLPHLRARPAPFAVVSTGTWVVSMAVGGRPVALDPGRDTLVNVNAFGDPVPSARFMGGREWEVAMQGRSPAMTEADAAAVLGRGAMLLPAIEPGSGPFPGRTPGWTVPESTLGDGERAVAVSWYLALMTAVCLGNIGAEGPVVVEGPFARNARYLAMLEAATGRGVVVSPAGGTGTSVGAALLVAPDAGAAPAGGAPAPRPRDARLTAYAEAWRGRL
jgi:sugar (pentulose or hexulose) kinase